MLIGAREKNNKHIDKANKIKNEQNRLVKK